MQNIVYTGIIVPARDSVDGETPTEIIVTHEANGHAIWLSGHDEGTMLVSFERHKRRDTVLEEAVAMVLRERKAIADA
ncbi:hypothetical protein WT88_29485 [Burkholderia stagnalis]|uniref:hypothetical protein n=1 Tax=Burkholderia stagnalis TaxID=1503054 RepID=UPI00075AD676|nr:hypothetical protein [Burkholderia stagnalis]KVZ18617.1 hypothetical protein WT35_04425 [Burkholderia stagnalis]KWN32840.1 hypothetical protein WT86_18550 [Burkholderia stagnalis]KWN44667.1 hypothetical protein WT88_29485 [Burkholderia stagnalis]KWN54400.1 hypothetical protein WT87_03580 [Burkholderia stagnalis]KWO68807.1 hypothetical protein WT99_20950 [Burkholderia stagnalis]